MTAILLGAAIIVFWGIGHLAATRSVIGGFGQLSDDNRRILTMEWVAEGITLCSLGILAVLVVLSDGLGSDTGRTTLYGVAAILFLLAGLSAATGAKTSISPMKACPIVKTVVAALFTAGAGLS